MQTILEFYEKFRGRFPEVTLKVDKEHIKYWGNLDPDFFWRPRCTWAAQPPSNQQA